MNSQTTTENLLDEIAATVGDCLMQEGFDERKCLEIGATCAEKVRANFGGQPIYVPMANRKVIEDRNTKIIAEFTGTNHAELASIYKVSTIHIYRIIKANSASRAKR